MKQKFINVICQIRFNGKFCSLDCWYWEKYDRYEGINARCLLFECLGNAIENGKEMKDKQLRADGCLASERLTDDGERTNENDI